MTDGTGAGLVLVVGVEVEHTKSASGSVSESVAGATYAPVSVDAGRRFVNGLLQVMER